MFCSKKEVETNKPVSHIKLIKNVSEFDDIVNDTAGRLLVFDLYADWCGPCKAVAPVLEELAEEYCCKMDIYKINTEVEQDLAAVFGIRSIPSILFVPKNDKPQMSMGALPKETFRQLIKEIFGLEKEAK